MLLNVHTLNALPGAPSTLAKGTDFRQINAARKLRLRLHLEGDDAMVSARPYYWFEDDWWPLRSDASTLTVATGSYNNRADGLFETGGISGPVIVVIEEATAYDSLKAYLDISDSEG